MAGRKKKDVAPRVSVSMVERVYRVLPFCLVLVLVFNLWFVYGYVDREKNALVLEREKIMLGVSNIYDRVYTDISRDIGSVNDFVRRAVAGAVFTGSVSNRSSFVLSPQSSSSVLSPSVTNSVPDSAYRFGDTVSADYFVVCGAPFLSFGGGSYCGVGDDFGFGVVERITRFVVVCDGVPFRLVPLAEGVRSVVRNERMKPNG